MTGSIHLSPQSARDLLARYFRKHASQLITRPNRVRTDLPRDGGLPPAKEESYTTGAIGKLLEKTAESRLISVRTGTTAVGHLPKAPEMLERHFQSDSVKGALEKLLEREERQEKTAGSALLVSSGLSGSPELPRGPATRAIDYLSRMGMGAGLGRLGYFLLTHKSNPAAGRIGERLATILGGAAGLGLARKSHKEELAQRAMMNELRRRIMSAQGARGSKETKAPSRPTVITVREAVKIIPPQKEEKSGLSKELISGLVGGFGGALGSEGLSLLRSRLGRAVRAA